MATKDFVSIVIPCYNAEMFLEKTLKSVIDQTHANYEAIVVNDGSTDGSLKIAKRLQTTDSRIRIIESENRGLAHARNLGVSHARGEWIAFLDADDLWKPALLETAIKRLHQKNADCFYTKTINLKNGKYEIAWQPVIEGDLFSLLISGNFIIISSCVMHRDIFHKMGFYFKDNIYGHEDWQIFLEMAYRGINFCGSQEALTIKMWHEKNMSYEDAMHQSGVVVKRNADAMWAEFKSRALSLQDLTLAWRYIRLTGWWTFLGMPKTLRHYLYRLKVRLKNKLKKILH